MEQWKGNNYEDVISRAQSKMACDPVKVFYISLTFYHVILLFYGLSVLTTKTSNLFYENCKQHTFRLITIWSHILQQFYFHMCTVLCLLPESLVLKTNVQSARSFLLFAVIIPVTMFVCLMFWAMFHYDREMLYPRELDEFLSPWLNHAYHTAPPPIILVHMLMSHNSAPSVVSAVVAGSAFVIGYFLILIGTFLVEGKWLYIVLSTMSRLQLALLFCLSYALYVSFVFTGIAFNLHITRYRVRSWTRQLLQKNVKCS